MREPNVWESETERVRRHVAAIRSEIKALEQAVKTNQDRFDGDGGDETYARSLIPTEL